MSRPYFPLTFYAVFAVFALPVCAQEAPFLQPHRAVYEIALASGVGRNSLSSASGKLTYDFTGSSCEGYSTKARFMTTMQSQDGTSQANDITSATFESADGKEMQFVTMSMLNGKITDFADGMAKIQPDGALKIDLSKPKKESFGFPAGILFPAGHTQGILNTAKNGDIVFRADLFDGSESARKYFATTIIVGKSTAEIPAGDAAASLAKMPHYNVALEFFDPKTDQSGEQLALYNTHSVMFDNGITYSMRLDYPDFTFNVKLASLELLPVGKCK